MQLIKTDYIYGMKKIEVCLSPGLIHLYDIKEKTIIIVDIFRATTTMVTALANGVVSIAPFKSLEKCKSMKKDGYIIAGERDGKKADGFELGNSPLSYLEGTYKGKKLAMTTTNGTLAIDSVSNQASQIIIGAFINLDSTVSFLKNSKEDLLIYCAGWKGKFNLEDSLYAGALADSLADYYQSDCDSTLAVKSLFQTNKKDLKKLLSNAAHTKRLQNQNIEEDIDFCLSMNLYETVVLLKEGKIVSI